MDELIYMLNMDYIYGKVFQTSCNHLITHTISYQQKGKKKLKNL